MSTVLTLNNIHQHHHHHSTTHLPTTSWHLDSHPCPLCHVFLSQLRVQTGSHDFVTFWHAFPNLLITHVGPCQFTLYACPRSSVMCECHSVAKGGWAWVAPVQGSYPEVSLCTHHWKHSWGGQEHSLTHFTHSYLPPNVAGGCGPLVSHDPNLWSLFHPQGLLRTAPDRYHWEALANLHLWWRGITISKGFKRFRKSLVNMWLCTSHSSTTHLTIP